MVTLSIKLKAKNYQAFFLSQSFQPISIDVRKRAYSTPLLCSLLNLMLILWMEDSISPSLGWLY